MPEIKTKVSLYFPADLYEEFESARKEEEEKIGVALSKNEFGLRLIKKSLEIRDIPEELIVDPAFITEAKKRGVSPRELQSWLVEEVHELSEKYDRLEELIEKINNKNDE